MYKVVVSSAQYRKSFDVFNCINKNYDDLDCYALASKPNCFLNYAYYNKISTGLKSLDDFNDKIIYIPTEEVDIEEIYEFQRCGFTTNLSYLVPPQDSFDTVRNKSNFSDFCVRNDISAPKEYSVDEITLLGKLPCPLIIKPKIGSGSTGIVFVDTYKEFMALSQDFLSKCIIQQRLSETVHVQGAFFLCNKGEVVSSYCHSRIETFPKTGGVSLFSRATNNETITRKGAEILRSLNWSGFAMVEFIFDPIANDYFVIEVNPRLWGSVLLSQKSGSNILINYINILRDVPVVESQVNEDRYILWPFPFGISRLFKVIISGDLAKVGFVNFTYTSIGRSLSFIVSQFSSLSTFSKIISKVIS